MKSTKILTINPFPSGVNQKLVPAKKYNELVEDVQDLENKTEDLQDQIDNLPSGGGGIPLFDKGLAANISFTVVNGVSTSLSDNGAGVGEAVIAFTDLVTSIQNNGPGVLLYGIRRTGEFVYTIINTDPNAVLLPLDSSDVGGVVQIDVAISDDNWNTLFEIPAGCYAQVFNPGGFA